MYGTCTHKGNVASVVVGNFGAGMYDALRAYVTGILGGKDEIEQFYLGIWIMETVGGMVGTIAWSADIEESVGSLPWVLRVPYGVCALLMAGALGWEGLEGGWQRVASTSNCRRMISGLWQYSI